MARVVDGGGPARRPGAVARRGAAGPGQQRARGSSGRGSSGAGRRRGVARASAESRRRPRGFGPEVDVSRGSRVDAGPTGWISIGGEKMTSAPLAHTDVVVLDYLAALWAESEDLSPELRDELVNTVADYIALRRT